MEFYYQQYAKILLQNGVHLLKGQVLFIEASIHTMYIIPYIVKEAYRLHANQVYVQYFDQRLDRIKADYCDANTLSQFPNKRNDLKIALLNENTAYLTLYDGDNMMHSTNEYQAVLNSNLQEENRFRSVRHNKGVFHTCKTVTPTHAFARRLFPEKEENEAFLMLWECFAKILHLNDQDPVSYFNEKIKRIQNHVEKLNSMHLTKLIFDDSHSHFSVDLPDSHHFVGGCEFDQNGIPYIPNFPTEEIFTAPSKTGVNGIIYSSKPLYYQGAIINEFNFQIKQGKISHCMANQGEKELKQLLLTDEGSCYFGEIAIVEANNSIDSTNLIFGITLLDENAASHMAIGRSYLCNLNGQTRAEAKTNDSNIHVDFMFGTPQMNVVATDSLGDIYTIMKNGKLVI